MNAAFPAQIAQKLEQRLARAMAVVADEHIEVGGGVAAFSGVGSWSNQAVGLGFAGEISAADVQRIVEYHSSRGVQPKVELAPHAHSSCVARLREAGFVINGFEQVLVLALRLGAPQGAGEQRVAIEIVDPDDAAALEQFLRVQTWGFRSDETAEADQHDRRLFPRYVLHPNVRALLARVDGEPAGAALVEIEPPLAQLFGGATRPSLRGCGVQRALLAARLRLAQEAGCELAATESAPGGGTERNALRLGFSVAYTRVSLVRPGEGLAASP